MRWVSLIFVIIIILLGVSFAVLNAAPVPINYYFQTKQVPLSLLMAISLAVGALLGLLVMTYHHVGLRLKNKRLERKLRKLTPDDAHDE